jgi:lysophospholipase L1-like esterase
MRWGLFVVSALSCCVGIAQPTVLETYGDSVTAGFLSRTDVTAAPPLSDVSHMISDMAMFEITGNPNYIAPLHAPDLAWPSVLSRLEAKAGIPMTVVNRAVSGAAASDVVGQVQGAPAASGPVVALILIGHNDLCNRPDTPDTLAAGYYNNVNQALAAWDGRHTGSMMYLLPVGEINRVYHTLSGYVWFSSDQGKYACEESWKRLFPYCPWYADQFAAGSLDAYMNPRLAAFDQMLDRLAKEWEAKSGKNHFRFLANIQQEAYEKEYFAIDCFHLSPQGQSRIAERISQALNPADWE